MHREICVRDYSRTAAPRILKFYTNIGYDLALCKRDSAFTSLSFLLFVHFSFSQIKFVITDFSATTSSRILKYGTNIGYD